MNEDAPESAPEVQQVLISQIRVGRTGVLRATLGSCVGIALLSRKPPISGLAHCLLPEAPGNCASTDARYASLAVANLLRLMGLDRRAARRVKAYLGGGGKVLQPLAPEGRKHIGQLNLEASRAALKQLGIVPIEIATGGDLACSMTLDCETQRVLCQPIHVAELEPLGSPNLATEEIFR